jgi:hypothetical protein
MKYWLITLAISAAWLGLVLGGMVLHSRGQDSFLEQQYWRIAVCGLVVIWAAASFWRIARKARTSK